MKKFMFNSAAGTMMALALSPAASALTPLFSFEAGVHAWYTENDGDLSLVGTDKLGIDGPEPSLVLWGAFEHPIPLIPNARIEIGEMGASGDGTLGQLPFQFPPLGDTDNSVAAETDVTSNYDMSYADLGIYYNFFVVDFGITLRQYEIDATINGANGDTASKAFSQFVPMGYAAGKFGLPFSGFYGNATVNVTNFDDVTVSDYRAALGWEKEFTMLARFAIELGYRSMDMSVEQEGEWLSDINSHGPYLGLEMEL